MEIILDHAEQAETTVIRAVGKGTVRSAAGLHAVLIETLVAPGTVVLDVSGVTEIDAAFLQLACAAGKSAAASGRAFRLEGGAGELAQKFAAAGFPLAPGGTAAGTAILCGHGGATR